MRIITKRRLQDYATRHPDAQVSLRAWQVRIRAISPSNLAALRGSFPSVDLVSRLTVFNIGGNNYRLIARVEYERQEVYLRHFLTHSEYDKGRWKNDEWY